MFRESTGSLLFSARYVLFFLLFLAGLGWAMGPAEGGGLGSPTPLAASSGTPTAPAYDPAAIAAEVRRLQEADGAKIPGAALRSMGRDSRGPVGEQLGVGYAPPAGTPTSWGPGFSDCGAGGRPPCGRGAYDGSTGFCANGGRFNGDSPALFRSMGTGWAPGQTVPFPLGYGGEADHTYAMLSAAFGGIPTECEVLVSHYTIFRHCAHPLFATIAACRPTPPPTPPPSGACPAGYKIGPAVPFDPDDLTGSVGACCHRGSTSSAECVAPPPAPPVEPPPAPEPPPSMGSLCPPESRPPAAAVDSVVEAFGLEGAEILGLELAWCAARAADPPTGQKPCTEPPPGAEIRAWLAGLAARSRPACGVCADLATGWLLRQSDGQLEELLGVGQWAARGCGAIEETEPAASLIPGGG